MNKFVSIGAPIHPKEFLAFGTHQEFGPISRIRTPSSHLFLRNSNDFCKNRAITLYSKEPCTITFIDSLPKDVAFIDIGANIGVYSMYALAEGVSRIISIEPSIFNSYELYQNRLLNDKNGRCFPINAAVADGSRSVELLSLNGTKAGHSFNQVGSNDWSRHMQPVMTLPLADLDRFCEGRPVHIKLDVDGIEGTIVEAITKVVDVLNIRSLQVEFDQNRVATRDACRPLFDLGFEISPEQMAFRREGLRNPKDVHEQYLAGEHSGNVLFSRDPALFANFKEYF